MQLFVANARYQSADKTAGANQMKLYTGIYSWISKAQKEVERDLIQFGHTGPGWA